MTCDEIMRRARQANVTLVRFLYCGNDGVLRGKMTHIDFLAQRLRTGMGLPMAVQSLTCWDEMVPASGLGPVGEVRLLPDRTLFTVLPWVARQARLWCDLVQVDQQPWSLCPRSCLRRILAQASQWDLQVQAAFENEFYLVRHEASPSTSFTP